MFLEKDEKALEVQQTIEGHSFHKEKSDSLSSESSKSSESFEVETKPKTPKEETPTYDVVRHKEPGPVERPFIEHSNTHIYFLWYCNKHREYIFRVCNPKHETYFTRAPQGLLNFKLNFNLLLFII